MRSIEAKMINALRLRKSWKLNNTEVCFDGRIATVKLHGNMIAELDFAQGDGIYTLANWPTVTTRSRLNALLSEFAWGARFFQSKNSQFFSDGELTREIEDSEFVNLKMAI